MAGRGGGGAGRGEPEHIDVALLVVRRHWFGELGEKLGCHLRGEGFGD